MFGVLLILLWFPGMNLERRCYIFEKISCHGIQQEDFFEELFRQERTLAIWNVEVVEITDSNYSVIESIMNPARFFPRVEVTHLKIRNSSIERIAQHAFQDLESLIALDLSHNRLKSMYFVETFESLPFIDLSYNNISVLDLNIMNISNGWEKLNLSHNSIADILPHKVSRLFSSLDLSYNRLQVFNETLLNCCFSSIDLRHNLIRNISMANKLECFHDIIHLEGNIITSLSCDDNHAFGSYQLFLTNIPNILPLQIDCSEILSIKNSQIETLNETVFDKKHLKQKSNYGPGLIEFCNSSIKDIAENYFSNIDLSLLNLSYNNISVLVKSLFKGSNIRELDLSYSGIKILSNRVFMDMHSIEVLNLTGNYIRAIENICKFVGISSIDLSYNMIESIGSGSFGKCEFLQTLNISNSQMSVIEEGAFSNVEYLNVLNLSNNRLKRVDVNTFRNLKYISVIDLSGNDLSIMGTDAFSKSTLKDLRCFKANIGIIKYKAINNLFSLENLNLSYSGITDLEGHAFFNLSALITLDLSNNNLTMVKSYTFSNLPIRFLFLNGNRIKTIQSGGFSNMNNLKFLNLSNLGIQTLEPFAFTGLKIVDTIDMSNNNITEVKANVFADLFVEHIDLTKNNITKIAPMKDKVTVTKLSLQFNGVLGRRAISNIYVRDIFFVDSSLQLESGCFNGLYNLEKLFFNNSIILSYESDALRGLFQLKYLDASNFFRMSNVVRGESFADLRNMRTLDLSNSNLTGVQARAFIGLQSLEKLYLGGNELQSLRGDIFDDYASLKILDLSNSSFTSIDLVDILNKIKILGTIRLSCGKLTNLIVRHDEEDFSNSFLVELFLDNNLIEYFDNIKLTNLRTLHLQNNRLNISYGTFRYFSRLVELRLDGNHLTKLGPGIFEGLTNLRYLNLSNNPEIFKDIYDLPFLTLHQLRYLNIERTGLSPHHGLRDFTSYKQYFPDLDNIYIGNNGFSCERLFYMIQYFDKNHIHHPSDDPKYNERNIDGIVC